MSATLNKHDGPPAPNHRGTGEASSSEPDWRLVLSDAERHIMLNDIASVALAAARALWPEQEWDDLDVSAAPNAAPASPTDAPTERLGWMARRLPEIAEAVAQIARDPLTRLEAAKRPIAPPARARRVEPSAWAGAVQRGHAARWVMETTTCLTPDTPENRAVLQFLRVLLADCAAMALAADAGGEREWHALAQTLAAHLRALLSHPFWQGVSAPLETSPFPPVEITHAPYARLAQWMREHKKGFAFDWDCPLFHLPARAAWQIYEAWCVFQTLAALQSLGFSPASSGAVSPLLSRRGGRVSVRLARGAESGLLLRGPHGETLRLWVNPVFDAGQRSRSRALYPDIALEDAAGHLWLLDAKLKAYGEAGEEAADINQMHAYRDAILGRRNALCVQRAWCLFAGALNGGGRSQITYGPMETSVVGGLRLRPGQPEGRMALNALLAAWRAGE